MSEVIDIFKTPLYFAELKLDNKKISITKSGEELIEKTTNRINEKIIKIFKKIDPKNMSGFINIIESL